jgi:hypothetical protein
LGNPFPGKTFPVSRKEKVSVQHPDEAIQQCDAITHQRTINATPQRRHANITPQASFLNIVEIIR